MVLSGRKWVVRIHTNTRTGDRIYAVRVFYTEDDERDERMAREYAQAPVKFGATGFGWPEHITYTELAYTVEVDRFEINGKGGEYE